MSIDPGETTDLSGANPKLFEEMKAEYQAYASRMGVLELKPDENAIKILADNLTAKAVNKYWPFVLCFVLALIGTGYVAFKLGGALLRRKPA
jgi:arylsulfatase/uncharacterized sulfatase